jgi:hypothetical protein
VPPTENPDRILGALLAIAALSEDEFESYFGDLIAHVERHYDGSTVELPFADAEPSDMLVYQQDVYVEPDPTTFEPPVVEQFLARLRGDSDSQAVVAKELLDATDFDELDCDIEAVAGVRTLHSDEYGNERVSRGETPLDRDPDATIDLVPLDPAEITTSFQHHIVSHLAYQIRDCFLLMGVKPPVAFRTTGWGKYRATLLQRFCPQYENYRNADAVI